ncbi:HAD family hydrolase [Halostella sp. JP-L12]|uniref:HAD family hydrolase n=1 Tax=Halostella TaxID=1843185 RepID=UPI000EF82C2C|nr:MULTISPECIES: HAD family hydrolase [Halostella]NHN48747.1 HAD family hydrolase [Halostella sp. JP-L12]
MTGVTAVLFGLDGTLCEQRRPSREVLATAFDRVGVDPFFTVEEYRREAREIGGTGSVVDRRTTCFERLARRKGRSPDLGRLVADAYEVTRDYTDVRLLPGAGKALDALADRYDLGLVTNGGPDTQSPKIDALRLRSVFDATVLAGYETAPKPDPEPFEVAMAALDASPAETVHVGTSPRADVAGAAASGVESAWIASETDGSTPSGEEPDYVRRSIRDLLPPPWRRESAQSTDRQE